MTNVNDNNTVENYVAWLEKTDARDLPPGEDMSDLAALGEIRLSFGAVSDTDAAHAVKLARDRGRPWWRIAQFLGISEEEAETRYGTTT